MRGAKEGDGERSARRRSIGAKTKKRRDVEGSAGCRREESRGRDVEGARNGKRKDAEAGGRPPVFYAFFYIKVIFN